MKIFNLGLPLSLLAIFHLQLWGTSTIQNAVSFQQESGYVAGWSKGDS